MAALARKEGPVRVRSLELLSDADWDTALADAGRPFRFSHRSVAGRAFERAYPSYRYTPCRAEYSDGAIILYPLVKVQRRVDAMSMVLGMPLGLEGTPVALAGAATAQHIQTLFNELDECGQLELFGGAGGSPPAVGSVQRYETHTLALSQGFDAIWDGSFTAKTRNMCRKAERAGVVVTRDASAEAVVAFAELYARIAQSWESGGPPPRDDLFEAIMASGEAELWLGRVGEQVAAGALLLRGSVDLFYWAGAMDREYRAAAPSNAVIRTVLEDACDRGVTYFDFGASTGLPTVESFKRSFGAQPREYRTIALSSRRFRQLEWARQRLSSVRSGR